MPGAAQVPVIPPKDPLDRPDQISIRTTQKVVVELDLIAETEERSRGEVANLLWDWALQQYWKDKGLPRPVDPAADLEKVKGSRRKRH